MGKKSDKPLLSPGEIAILKRVAILSAAGCFAIVAVVWGVQMLLLQSKSGPRISSRLASRSAFRGATALQNLDIEAHACAAEYYLRVDQPQRAVRHLERILSNRKGLRRTQLQLATALLKSGSYSEARREFNDLIDERNQDSLTAPISARYALSLFYTGDTRESVERLRLCAQQHPSNPEAACYLGQVLAASESPQPEAEEWFDASIRLDPTYVEARYQQARYFMSGGEYLRSRDSMLKILEIEPLHAKTHSRLGMAYYYLNQPELAKKYYQTALALNPNDYNTRYNLGEVLFSSDEDANRALVEFRRVLDLKPDHTEANFKAGIICASSGLMKEAVGFLEEAASGGGSVRILLQLGAAYEKLQMTDNAIEVYSSILRSDALNPIALQKIRMLRNSSP